MSRSRKKSPAGGNTTAESDKWFKQKSHRLERRTVRIRLARDEDPPAPKAFGDPWASPKDGKGWYGHDMPELMRK